MTQGRIGSLVEALVNTLVGFITTMLVYPVINWICGIEMDAGQATLSVILFTLVSIVRGYIVRRAFNNMAGIKKGLARFVSKKVL